MRQRRVKKRSTLIQSCADYIYVGRPADGPDRRDIISPDLPELTPIDSRLMPGVNKSLPLYLEIGSGKGSFLTKKAIDNPKAFYLACEGGININVRIMQKAKELELKNLLVITEYISSPCDWFNENSLNGIYINFCDPWPKERHAHRRLTHRKLLEDYKKIVKPGAMLEFKTDNEDLFNWSLEEFKAAGLEEIEFSRDLWNSEYKEKNTPTEYEEKFAALGKNINYIKLRLK